MLIIFQRKGHGIGPGTSELGEGCLERMESVAESRSEPGELSGKRTAMRKASFTIGVPENPYSSRCEASGLKVRAAQVAAPLATGSPRGVPGKRTGSPSVPSPSHSIGPPVPAPTPPTPRLCGPGVASARLPRVGFKCPLAGARALPARSAVAAGTAGVGRQRASGSPSRGARCPSLRRG
ncbi:unnamed protein product [Rangifer tarandus platyrhynchus]|uniref:Uncharacterized protein n=1 Tax=Rangifer tarandus platyrhynchus TaxID=3082113 RepID=A0ABN8YRE6_RANTA|nr:unnamed protein product [Rangifer tarandus platyrhynchus]